MHEKTAKQYLGVLKGVLDTAKLTAIQIADAAGAKSEEERKAFKQGMQTVNSALRSEKGEAVQLPIGWGEPDWKKLKQLFIKAPEPSREDKEAALKLMKTVPHVLRRAMLKTAKSLPHAPGGPSPALSEPQALAACKRIEAYRTNDHLDTAEAIERVALELNRRNRTVSPKTLRRRYNEYVDRSA